ncbi:hypothetical protein PVAP13_7KG140785 [Panicum virgatum]|uniref:Uncharacterized protein n=1 Tax=Panicum virgatum TaxID=38727 RepID=A0A8T0QBP9_PANVG|nr:hypothetical protein PVAP13_7KG140785 [Panicum virgatum]
MEPVVGTGEAEVQSIPHLDPRRRARSGFRTNPEVATGGAANAAGGGDSQQMEVKENGVGEGHTWARRTKAAPMILCGDCGRNLACRRRSGGCGVESAGPLPAGQARLATMLSRGRSRVAPAGPQTLGRKRYSRPKGGEGGIGGRGQREEGREERAQVREVERG